MKYILKDALKNEYIFFNPKSVTLIREKNVPADSLDVLFLSGINGIEYAEIAVFDGFFAFFIVFMVFTAICR